MRHAAAHPVVPTRTWPTRLALGAVVLVGVVLAAVVALTAVGVPVGDPRPLLAAGEDGPGGVTEEPTGRADGPAPSGLPGRPAPTTRSATPERGVPGEARPWARGLLAAWDRERERAWRRGDAEGVRDLYVPGSSAAAVDADLLRRWAGAGLRVRALRLRVDELRVRALEPRRVVLEVTDRLLVRADDADPATPAVRMGRDRPSTRVVELHRRSGRWQVARVLPVAG